MLPRGSAMPHMPRGSVVARPPFEGKRFAFSSEGVEVPEVLADWPGELM